ncbi:hypothetical protein [Iningainema tapete]|uniref:Uncharacterized protein n=1 Tax=Iningainema tapete BLCC-T55 TaxID=2748662 RepID=A0A8J6XCU8_9CYAN|nr:hypothetical protein [Iningainema tapete]MBD2770650.1 hypothetical protein [Iningainema tapete BLCC-T55]
MPKVEGFRLPDDILSAIASRVEAGEGNKTDVVVAALRRGLGLLAPPSSKPDLLARVHELETKLQELSQQVEQHSTLFNELVKHNLTTLEPTVKQESTLLNQTVKQSFTSLKAENQPGLLELQNAQTEVLNAVKQVAEQQKMNESLMEQLHNSHQEQEQLLSQLEQLRSENESLAQRNQVLQEELNNLSLAPAISLPELQLVRVSVLKTLTSGKGKVATTSPQYKTAARALDRFILELRESTPASTPASSAPDGTAAPLVDEAIKKLSDKHYTKAEYYTDLRQIVESCGYRLFIDTTTLGRGRELFIVNPPGDSLERVISTQDIGEVVDWLRKQDLME